VPRAGLAGQRGRAVFSIDRPDVLGCKPERAAGIVSNRNRGVMEGGWRAGREVIVLSRTGQK